ncbi:hypothetical protein [Thiobacillus sp.]|uniref:hypothetical protein n=1 Tax=Thiobacillus sp. TaxID=924 RepID=UPI0011D432A2|nr:hypothetical protein [Thiobacillus sp.]TXH74953.1 MAG: hypothetical protein E6Q82_08165 [Thiobacillus sp.]
MSITNSWKMLFQLKGITPGGAFFRLSRRLEKNSRHPVENSQAHKKAPLDPVGLFVSVRHLLLVALEYYMGGRVEYWVWLRRFHPPSNG